MRLSPDGVRVQHELLVAANTAVLHRQPDVPPGAIKTEGCSTVLVCGRVNEKVRAGTFGLGWRFAPGIGFSGLANGIFCGGAVLDVASIAGPHA